MSDAVLRRTTPVARATPAPDDACLETLAPLALTRDTLFVCRDAALDDTTAASRF
jgi:hypothetical protein